MVKNLIQDNYLVSSTNYVICLDVTKLGLYGELLICVDLASRCIVGHCYKDSLHPIKTHDIILTLTEVIRKRSFLPNIAIIHTDRGSIFSNSQFIDFIESQSIRISRGSSSGHDNQVIERLNRTLKDIIRVKLGGLPKNTKKDFQDVLLNSNLSENEISPIIFEAIETYNNKPHSAFKRRASPNIMEEALFKAHQNQHPTSEIVPIMGDSYSEEIQYYQNQVLQNYEGDWIRFFVDWRLQQEQFQNQQLQFQSKLESKLDETTKLLEDSELRYKTLYTQFLEIQRQLEAVFLESERQKEEELAKEQKRALRKSRKRKPLRDTIAPEEFQNILSLTSGKVPYIVARRKVALVLLYLTGLRISNLLLLEVRHIRELSQKGSTKIQLIKKGESRHTITLSSAGRQLLKSSIDDISLLIHEKSGSDLVFTNLYDTKGLRREVLNREINEILIKASALMGKTLRSHSFRASIITDLLDSEVPIDQVKEVMGHKAIGTTLEYKRSKLSLQQKKEIISRRLLK